MAQGMERVAQLVRDVNGVLDGSALARVQRHVGGRAKGQALGAAAKSLGGDRAMRNFKRGRAQRSVKLGAGWDAVPSGVVVNLRPGGLWKLAESGRKRSGTIRPRAVRRRGTKGLGRGRAAVRTPKGYAASAPYGPSRGVKSLTTAKTDIQRVSGRATDEALRKELARVVAK